MSDELHTLTGAYAADALPEDERRRFEAHLGSCLTCRDEVASLQAAAARLGAAAHRPPPPGLKERVMGEIERTRQDPAPVAVLEDRRPSPWYLRVLAPVAAVLAVAVIGLVAMVADLNSRIGQLEASSTRMAEIAAADDARLVSATGDGSRATAVVSPGRGEGVFVAEGLASLPADRTYQLWLLGSGDPVPAGVFRTDDQGRALRVVTGDMAAAEQIGVTVEPRGGSRQPTTDPVLLVPLDEA